MSYLCRPNAPLARQIVCAIAVAAFPSALIGCGATEAEDVQRVAAEQVAGEFRSSPHLQLAASVARRGMRPKDGEQARDELAADTAHRGWKSIVLHHTATETGSVESIHAQHVRRKDASGNPWLGIGYHFIIGNGRGMKDGEIQSTFRWREQRAGAHAGERGYNETGIGICLVGDFNREPPTDAQQESLSRLIRTLQEQFRIPDSQLIRHGDIKATACPGKLFELDPASRSPKARSTQGRHSAGRSN